MMAKYFFKLLGLVTFSSIGVIFLFVAFVKESTFYLIFAWYNMWQFNNIIQDKDNE